MNRDGYIHFAHVPERVSTKSCIVLMIGNSKLNHVGAQGTLTPNHLLVGMCLGSCVVDLCMDVFIY